MFVLKNLIDKIYNNEKLVKVYFNYIYIYKN